MALHRHAQERSMKSEIISNIIGAAFWAAFIYAPISIAIYCMTHSTHTVISTLVSYNMLRACIIGACIPTATFFTVVCVVVVWGAVKEAMKPRPRQALPGLELTLPGLEEAIASHGGRRWSESRGGARQPVNKAVARPRIEPVFDKPIR
jgi:hypothetical protein